MRLDPIRIRLPRLFAALPDAVTAGVFLLAWIAPAIPGPQYVKNLMLTMLIEFVVMHSSAFYAGLNSASDLSRGKRVLILLGLSAFYLTFIVGFSFAFDSTWPVFAFAWLLATRFVHLWTHAQPSADESGRTMLLWGASGAAYVIGAILTVLLPLPALGITPDFVSSMHLSGSGEWIERPYTVLAFGTLYFATQAWAKYALAATDAASATPQRPAAQEQIR